MKSLKNMTGDSLEQMIDFKVVDQNGDDIGSLHSLWSDPSTGGVEFLGVKTGWLFGHNHVVPAEKAELDETQNVVRLPYTSLFVKEAPSMSADAEISEAEEENIYRYYGMSGAGGTTPATSTTTAPSAIDMSKIPEAAGASSLASASGRDEGGSQFGAPTSNGGGDTGVSRLRRTVRTETAGMQINPATSAGTGYGTPSAGSAVRGALDSLSPGDSSSTSTTTSSAAAPSSYGTANLYGSTGTATPVSADSLGASMDAPASGSSEATTTGYLGTSMDAGATSGERSSTTTGYLSGGSAEPDANPDPITGEPGSHPVGTGAGALAGGAAGLAIGAVVGGPIGAPVGAAIGAIVGTVGGGYAGKGLAESINPTEENAFWESNYEKAPYYEHGTGFADYAPAYKVGYEGYGRHAGTGKDYPEVEDDLKNDYDQAKGTSRLEWEKAKSATRDAWDRLKAKASDATK